jgi:hypothetical protein
VKSLARAKGARAASAKIESFMLLSECWMRMNGDESLDKDVVGGVYIPTLRDLMPCFSGWGKALKHRMK